MPREKYKARWADETTDLQIELACIARGGKWKAKTGEECGAGMLDHLFNARKLIWPDRYRHRWTDLLYSEFVRNDITILMGAASTQKTSHASEFVLLNYWARPNNTLAILSTITMDKLDTGVFGEMKMLWQAGRKLHPFLAGNLLENKRAIVTDNLEETKTRDMRKGVVGRACYIGGKWVGLGVLAGTKQEYVFYLCDEIQFMAESFIGSWPNLFSNGHVKVIGSGNPKHDPDDQLGIAAEPKDGWTSQGDNRKTQVWETQFMGGRCINLVGIDSPNFDTPEGEPEPYPKLIGRKFAKRIAHDWTENSPEYYTQVMGVMRIDMADARVITRQLCRQHGAQDRAIWKGGPTTKVYGLDPAYGGGDKCIAFVLEFGDGIDNKVLLEIVEKKEITIDVTKDRAPEDQIADAVETDLQRWEIPVHQAFYDPYGKGTLGYAFARKFGTVCPRPVDSGGPPSERPVRDDLFVEEQDGKRRPKTCREHYSKFVTEAWFSVRYAIEANQLRNLPTTTMLEGCARKYGMVAGNKVSVESKEDYKARVKHSPNEFDALAVGVEGARVLGFRIARLGADVIKRLGQEEDFFAKEAKKYEDALKSGLLDHSPTPYHT
jgi:hypothetical protein